MKKIIIFCDCYPAEFRGILSIINPNALFVKRFLINTDTEGNYQPLLSRLYLNADKIDINPFEEASIILISDTQKKYQELIAEYGYECYILYHGKPVNIETFLQEKNVIGIRGYHETNIGNNQNYYPLLNSLIDAYTENGFNLERFQNFQHQLYYFFEQKEQQYNAIF